MKEKVIGLILGGGSGVRFGSDTPKQFLKIRDKEIIIYTIEQFQINENIDEICLVYPKGWLDYTKNMVNKYNLTKVKYFVEGGETRQISCFKGSRYLSTLFNEEEVVIIDQDGDRPLIDQTIINDSLRVFKENGCGWSCINSCNYVVDGNENEIYDNIETHIRRNFVLTTTPCSFLLRDINKMDKYCQENNIDNMIIFGELWLRMGNKIYPSKSSIKNSLKLTIQEDFEIISKLLEE